MLPTFLICGTPKAGTTSLFTYLNQHPDIFGCSIKEPMFFCNQYDKGLAWYESLFKEHNQEKAIGEASPWYMRDENSPARIFKVLPDTKLLFILRNPVDRAYSDYWFGKQRGTVHNSLSFSEIIRSYPEFNGIVPHGFYYQQISRYLQYFDKTKMFFVVSEEFYKETHKTLKCIFNFLEVEDSFIPQKSTKRNSTFYPRHVKIYNFFATKMANVDNFFVENKYLRPIRRKLFFSKTRKKPKMKDSDRSFLLKIYQEDISQLSQLIEQDLSHWQ